MEAEPEIEQDEPQEGLSLMHEPHVPEAEQDLVPGQPFTVQEGLSPGVHSTHWGAPEMVAQILPWLTQSVFICV